MFNHKTTLLASFGSGLEYFDFVTFALLAPYLNLLFFPHDHHAIGLIKTFGLFALGYLARPIGGVFFGMLSDTFGRKKIFLWVIALIGFSTTAIALLPTYSHVGMLAPILLLAMRLLQGLSFGAELPSALVFVAEHAKPTKRGQLCGILIGTVSLGNSLAALICYLLTRTLTQAHMLSIGWRLPFLVGGLLAFINYFTRRSLNETPLFRQQIKSKKVYQPLISLFKEHSREIVQGCALLLFSAATIIVGLSLPAQLHLLYHFSLNTLYLSLSLASCVSIVAIPLLGAYSDKWGRKKLYLVAIITAIVSQCLLFLGLKMQTTWMLWVFMFGYQGGISLLAACYFTLLTELFTTTTRVTGYAFCYNCIFAIISFLPALAIYLIHRFSSTDPLMLILVGFGLLSLIGASMIDDKTGRSLQTVTN